MTELHAIGNGKDCNRILPNLHLSSCLAARDRNVKSLGFGLVVNAVTDLPVVNYGEEVRVIKIPVRDRPDADLKSYFELVSDNLHKALSAGVKCLVHCVAGVSRSATLVAAYLIRYEGLTTEEALRNVKEKRRCANPNPAPASSSSWRRTKRSVGVRATEGGPGDSV